MNRPYVATINGQCTALFDERTEIVVKPETFTERSRLELTRKTLLELGNHKMAEARRLTLEANDACEQAQRIKEQLQVVP